MQAHTHLKLQFINSSRGSPCIQRRILFRHPALPWPMLGASTSTAIYWQENPQLNPIDHQLIKEIRNSFEQSKEFSRTLKLVFRVWLDQNSRSCDFKSFESWSASICWTAESRCTSIKPRLDVSSNSPEIGKEAHAMTWWQEKYRPPEPFKL